LIKNRASKRKEQKRHKERDIDRRAGREKETDTERKKHWQVERGIKHL